MSDKPKKYWGITTPPVVLKKSKDGKTKHPGKVHLPKYYDKKSGTLVAAKTNKK